MNQPLLNTYELGRLAVERTKYKEAMIDVYSGVQ